MSAVVIYEDEKKYDDELKYWSDCLGNLYDLEGHPIDITDLPPELRKMSETYFEENKDGHYVYLAQYKGVNGIILCNEYYETEDGEPTPNNPARAVKVAELLALTYPKCKVMVAKGIGFNVFSDDGYTTELVVFVPHDVDKTSFDIISRVFGRIAYRVELFKSSNNGMNSPYLLDKIEYVVQHAGKDICKNMPDVFFEHAYRAMHDYGMSFADADAWAWLNTLFGYDIGAERALFLISWGNDRDINMLEMHRNESSKKILQEAAQELGLNLDFSALHPEAISYIWPEHL